MRYTNLRLTYLLTSDRHRGAMRLFVFSAPYKYSYLFTYLLTVIDFEPVRYAFRRTVSYCFVPLV